MGNYKLVALDMDGTFLNEKGEISEENRKAIFEAMEAGVTVMFATGRGIQSAMPHIEALGLKAPIVSVNGGEVWKEPGVLLHRQTLPADDVRRMREVALRHGTWYWGYTVEGLFNRDRWIDDINSVIWLKFGYQYEKTDVLAQIREELGSWDCLELSNSHPNNIEVNPKGVNKADGIRRVCELLGIGMEQVVAMGDSLNDITMIREAGLGVAMGNAQETVKQTADRVTLRNDEHGVAAAIRKYVLA
jgi:hypothetical protein